MLVTSAQKVHVCQLWILLIFEEYMPASRLGLQIPFLNNFHEVWLIFIISINSQFQIHLSILICQVPTKRLFCISQIILLSYLSLSSHYLIKSSARASALLFYCVIRAILCLHDLTLIRKMVPFYKIFSGTLLEIQVFCLMIYID